jgi:predicted unusual protein kinase regulating ubiquinone biosynthesis (AarF/ABC1/UbiB family)
MRLFFFQVFEAGAVHADPHPGNFLFNPDGTIGLVDFGCVKFLKPEIPRCYGQFWLRDWLHDREIYGQIVRVIFDDPNAATSPRVRRCMKEISTFYDQFHPLVEPPAVLDLGELRFMEAITNLAKTLLRNKFLTPEFLFLGRTETGMCNLLHLLKARLPTTGIAREFIGQGGGPRHPSSGGNAAGSRV